MKKIESKNNEVEIKNLINRNFKAEKPNQKWFIDTTRIEVDYDYLYCSVIIDGFNNQIIDLKISNHQDLSLTMTNLKEGLKDKDVSELTIHSSYGEHYLSDEFKNLLKEHNITQSMSKDKNIIDNRPAKFFFRILNSEYLLHLSKEESSLERLEAEIGYIMNHYNTLRR